MATLKRGVSFRRQGSSGLSWAENWTFTEDGSMFQVSRSKAATGEIGKQISVHTSNPASCMPSTLPRSSSSGGSYNVDVCIDMESSRQKSRSGVLNWLKGRIRKVSRS